MQIIAEVYSKKRSSYLRTMDGRTNERGGAKRRLDGRPISAASFGVFKRVDEGNKEIRIHVSHLPVLPNNLQNDTIAAMIARVCPAICPVFIVALYLHTYASVCFRSIALFGHREFPGICKAYKGGTK